MINTEKSITPKVISVTGGKGGVGKTNIAANLSVLLAMRNRQVLLLDADMGLANADVILGIESKNNLSEVVNGELSLEEIIVNGPAGVKFLPAPSGMLSMGNLSQQQHYGIINAVGSCNLPLDYLIIDSAAGINDGALLYSGCSDEVIVVVTPEKTSLVDAYAIIKILHQKYNHKRFHIVVNMVHISSEGFEVFAKLSSIATKFLDVVLHLIAILPHDMAVRKAINNRRSVVIDAPKAKIAKALTLMADKVDKIKTPAGEKGKLQFYFNKAIATPNQQQQFG